jgi:protein FAM50
MSQTAMLGASKGNEAQRILGGEKKRQDDKAAFEATKKAIQEKNKVTTFNNKFGTSKGDVLQTEYVSATVGLVTLDQLKKTKEELAKKEVILEHLNREKEIKAELEQQEKASKKRKGKVSKTSLSFAEDLEEGAEEEEVVVKKRIVKNPAVNTSFLPDRDRELQEIEKRKQLTEEWTKEQEKKKAERLEITFSYWDGSGHRRSVTCTKGTSMGQFLEIARKSLMDEFRELRGCSSDNLLYIKEDLIIPHDITFHYLIETKARGKSGPLFHFDVHEDVRTINDARIEKDESHAGKIVERHW